MVTAAAQRQRASLSDDTLRLAHHRPGPTSKVTFRVANLDPENYYGKKRNDWEPSEKKVNRTSQQILTLVDRDAREQCKEIVYSSLDPHKNHTNLIPAKNGFVGAVIRAYAGHFHLEIRPDDVWIAILTQLSLFINADPERFRGKFVAFEGKRNLTVVAIGSRATLNYGLLAVEMGKLLQENVVDPELREWIVPQFTTTTLDDTIASSMIMMSTLKEFFNYEFKILCGIPSVTLHGEKKDWEVLLQKVEKLKNYGLETTMWYHLLEPILSRFVKAWDDPEGEWNQQFWARVATTQRPIGPCGTPRYITGWITAFMPFNNEGKWHLKSALPHLIPESDYMAKKRTGDIEPGPTGDDSYKKLTRHELMFKYNTAAKAYPASAFPVFRDGKVSDQPLTVRYSGFGIEELGVRSLRDQTRWGRKGDVEGDYTWSSMQLVIDGSWYPRHPDDEVPQAVVKVDVHFNEHGREFESLLVVGVMGYEVEQIAKSGDKEQKRQHTPAIRNQIQSGPHLVQIANSFVEQLCDNDSSAPVNDPAGSGQCIDDTTADFESSLKPRVGWWIYEKWAPEEIAETKEKLGMRSRPQTKGRRRKPKRPNQVQD